MLVLSLIFWYRYQVRFKESLCLTAYFYVFHRPIPLPLYQQLKIICLIKYLISYFSNSLVGAVSYNFYRIIFII